MWRSLVAHFVRDEGAAGSNPVIPIGERYELGPQLILNSSCEKLVDKS